jgi:hypothetical protein
MDEKYDFDDELNGSARFDRGLGDVRSKAFLLLN